MEERRKHLRHKLLILDNDPDYLTILKYKLKQISCKIVSVSNSKDCLFALKNDFFKILLLDNMLDRGEKGIDLIPQIQEISPATRIIILTAFANDKDRIHSLNSCDGYIVKNFDITKLIFKVKSVLAQG